MGITTTVCLCVNTHKQVQVDTYNYTTPAHVTTIQKPLLEN